MTARKKSSEGPSLKAPASSSLNAKVKKIAALAVKLSKADDAMEVPVWRQQLDALLQGYLISARDDVLAEAIQAACEKGGRPAFDEVRGRLELFSTVRPFPGTPTRQMSLVAIPVLLVVDETFRTHGELTDEDALKRVAASLKQFELLPEGGEPYLVPYLYDAVEFGELKFSETYKLTRSITQAIAFGDKEAELRQTGWSDLEGVPGLRLFYLLGGCATDAGVQPLALSESEYEEEGEFTERLRQWTQAVAADLLELTGPGSREAMPAAPAMLYEAIENGVEYYREVDLHFKTAAMLEARNLPPSVLNAVVQAYGEDDVVFEYHITFVHEDSPRKPLGRVIFHCVPWSDSQENWEDLLEALSPFPFADIEPPGDLLSVEDVSEMTDDEDESGDSGEPEWKGHTLH